MNDMQKTIDCITNGDQAVKHKHGKQGGLSLRALIKLEELI